MPRQKKQVLKQRKDGRYCCKYAGIQFMGATSDEALEARQQYIDGLKYGTPVSSQLIGSYAIPWLKRTKIGVSSHTYNEAASLLEKLLKHIGNKRFDEIVPSDIKAVYSAEFDGLSNSYIKAAAQLYRKMFDAAVDDGFCKSNPARKDSAAPHKGTEETKTRAITAQEREWIETLCTGHRAHAAVMAMLYAGLRPQEAKAFDIDRDVDFDNGVLYVRESVHLNGSNQYDRTRKLKTRFSRREIPLFPPLREALLHRNDREAAGDQAKAEARAKRLKKPMPAPPKRPDEEPFGMLVRSADKKPVTVQAWRSLWESYVSAMETAINGCSERWYGKKREHKGIKLPPFQRFTILPYDLRHSFCTMCRDNGVEINTCVHWMGHKDAKMILKIYDEYTPERGKKEAERLEKSLFGMQNGMQK